MSWREQQRDASFRGAAFNLDSASAAFGRRNVTHEYPLRDKPFVEDLGRRTRSFRIEALLIGDDYMLARDALIAAAEQPGPGKLVHPHYGELQVSVMDFQVMESSAQGGMARITLDFLEAGELTFPAASSDTRRDIAQKASVASDGGIAALGSGFDIDGLPSFAVASPAGLIGRGLDQVLQLANFPLGNALARGTLNGLVSGLRAQLGTLLGNPLALGLALFNVVSALRRVAPSPGAALPAFTRLANFGSNEPGIVQTTATRAREAANQEVLIEAIRVAAVVNAASCIGEISFESYDQAIAIRERVLEPLDAIADTTRDDATFAALTGLRAAVVRDVARRGANSAKIARYTPPATVPALVISYALYEGVGRETEILARNAIAHPGFVPAGQSLEVLTDG